jgi:hypothetical protein
VNSSKQPQQIGEVVPGVAARLAEHRRRMAEEPGYRESLEADAKAREAESDRELEAWQQRTREQQTQDRRIAAGIPERVLKLFGRINNNAAIEAVREFIDGPETLLVLTGGEGPGKTVAACVGLDEYTSRVRPASRGRPERPYRGLLVKALDLVRPGTFDAEFWDGLAEWDLLVIDDIGTEPLDEKGWALANIHGLLDKRYDADLKTILTANLTWERFAARYCQDGGRLQGRLREVGAFIELDGESLRRHVVPSGGAR